MPLWANTFRLHQSCGFTDDGPLLVVQQSDACFDADCFVDALTGAAHDAFAFFLVHGREQAEHRAANCVIGLRQDLKSSLYKVMIAR